MIFIKCGIIIILNQKTELVLFLVILYYDTKFSEDPSLKLYALDSPAN